MAFILIGYCMSVDNSTNELAVSFENYKYLGNNMNIKCVEEYAWSGFQFPAQSVLNHSECKDYYLPVIVFFSLMTVFFCAGCDFTTELCLRSTTRITICDIYDSQCRLL